MKNLRIMGMQRFNNLLVYRIIILALMISFLGYYGWQVYAEKSTNTFVVYAFSTQEEVMTQAIIPTFEKKWEAETGEDIEIEAIFGPSATIAGQIVLSAPAEVALFSNAFHVDWLKIWGMVKEETQPVEIGCTPMVIVTRLDNPHNIAEFADLGKPGIKVLHSDPRISGAGEWGVLAEYGSTMMASGSPQQAELQLKQIWKNVGMLGSSARSALTLFELGGGDALITYEQDARLAVERGVPLEIVIPTRTILTAYVAVPVDKNISRRERPLIQAFLDFLLSEEGQNLYYQYHLRTLDGENGLFPKLSKPFTVQDLGGWKQASREIMDAIWHGDIEPGLKLELAPNISDADF
ncbi:MAG: extracellular solute-binding protein [Chloroflexota bacterium]|nr:MAG: extracellular solute-binding protein [Chloroflexota bacterium]